MRILRRSPAELTQRLLVTFLKKAREVEGLQMCPKHLQLVGGAMVESQSYSGTLNQYGRLAGPTINWWDIRGNLEVDGGSVCYILDCTLSNASFSKTCPIQSSNKSAIAEGRSLYCRLVLLDVHIRAVGQRIA
jgi:hypothetical protein